MASTPPSEVTLTIGDQTFAYPVVVGTDGSPGIDIGNLRSQTGLVALDYGFGNTASCESSASFVDGEAGQLRYRGYPVEQLADRSTFLEVSYLLIYGALPTQSELDGFIQAIKHHTLLNEEMKQLFDAFPSKAHPMGILSSATAAMSTFYEDFHDPLDPHAVDQSVQRLLAKLPTVAAFAHKKSIGQPYIYPRNDIDYTSNFLRMMFALPVEDYEVNHIISRALDVLFILHADHSQNCSTSTVRLVGSSQANLFASVAAGMNALWGPLHGGANQAVLGMLQRIQDDGADYSKYIARAKDKDDPFRLMGFGHRIYKNFDPRAEILKKVARDVFDQLGVSDPLLDIALKLEEVALTDEYFVERKLYPNVDFYSGMIFRALGFPVRMFTVLFAMGRLPGWIAQWKEMIEDPKTRIGRPRQVYVGSPKRDYVPMESRS